MHEAPNLDALITSVSSAGTHGDIANAIMSQHLGGSIGTSLAPCFGLSKVEDIPGVDVKELRGCVRIRESAFVRITVLLH